MAVAIPIISVVTALAGTAFSVYGAYEQQQAQQQAAEQQANAARQQAQYESEMAAYNAQVAEGNADLAIAEGKVEKQAAYEESLTKRQQAAMIVGQQRGQQAASGAVVDAGSALDLNLDTVEKGELDAFNIREQGYWADYNKQVEAWNFMSQAEGQNTQSAFSSMQASNISTPKTSFLPTAAGGLLSGVSQAGSNYYALTKK